MVGQQSRRRALVLIFLLASSVTCPGCIIFLAGNPIPGRWIEIAPGNPEWGGYVYDAAYDLQVDVFLADMKYNSHGPALAPGPELGSRKRDPMWGGPTAVAEYEANPEKWPKMTGVVHSGTRLRTTRMRKEVWSKNGPEPFVVYAEILDGPFAGEKVEITELSLHVECGAWPLKPDERLLTQIVP